MTRRFGYLSLFARYIFSFFAAFGGFVFFYTKVNSKIGDMTRRLLIFLAGTRDIANGKDRSEDEKMG